METIGEKIGYNCFFFMMLKKPSGNKKSHYQLGQKPQGPGTCQVMTSKQECQSVYFKSVSNSRILHFFVLICLV